MILLTAPDTVNSWGHLINTWGFPLVALIAVIILFGVAIKYGIKRIEDYEQNALTRTDQLEQRLYDQSSRADDERERFLNAIIESKHTVEDISRRQQQTIIDNTAIIGKATEQLGKSSEVIDKALSNQDKLMSHLESFDARDNQLMATLNCVIEKLDTR